MKFDNQNCEIISEFSDLSTISTSKEAASTKNKKSKDDYINIF
jgi:hypothetical protein